MKKQKTTKPQAIEINYSHFPNVGDDMGHWRITRQVEQSIRDTKSGSQTLGTSIAEGWPKDARIGVSPTWQQLFSRLGCDAGSRRVCQRRTEKPLRLRHCDARSVSGRWGQGLAPQSAKAGGAVKRIILIF
jgi:hypothetical protein